VGAGSVAAALHAHEGGDDDPAADVVVCADPERAAVVATNRAHRLPLLAVTGAGYVRSPSVEARFAAVVLLPCVERWVGLSRPAAELSTLLGRPVDHLPPPLRDHARALRLLAAALVRSGQLTDPTPPAALRPRPVTLWRGLQPVERPVAVRPVVLHGCEAFWDDDALEASCAGRAG
jgi:hypothetical protein